MQDVYCNASICMSNHLLLGLATLILGVSGLPPMQWYLSVLVKLQSAFHFSCTDQGLEQLEATSKRSFSAPVMSLSAFCLNLWTSTCLCLIALFKRASMHHLRAFHSADVGTTIDKTSNLSSTCIVLALVAGRQNCQP